MARKVSEAIVVKNFLAQWNNDLFEQCASHNDNEREVIAKRMKITTDNVQELEAVCSLKLMESDEDTKTDRWKYLEMIPDGINLMCVRFQSKELERRKADKLYKTTVCRRMKYRITDECLNFDAGSVSKQEPILEEEDRVIYPDVVLTVHVHRPMKISQHKHQDMTKIRFEQLVVQSTYQVLGRQKLTDLRDMIKCVNDLTVPGDLSENPDMDNTVFSKDIFKSGFFFIEDTFYNDMREDDARDYSEVICKWASNPERNMGPYKSCNMEDFTFLDLTVRLGHPYLYMHQGDCEHLIMFSDIRLLTVEDPQAMKDYPYLRRNIRRARTLCRVCSLQAARWVTYGSQFTPENPCFFCDACFRSLHYDQDNKKIGSFEAYKYFDNHAVI